MTNYFVEQIKTLMKDFLSREKTRAKEIKRNSGYYSAEMATTKNTEITNQSENDYLSVINEINNIFKIIKHKVTVSSFPKSTDISDDVKLFDGTLPLAQAEVEVFIDKYCTNETMLRVISNYIDENFAENPTVLAYLKAKIPSARNILEKYQRIFQSAINIVGVYHNNPSGSQESSIDDFATDLSVIGSGQYLQMYNVNPNEVLSDTFSDIFLIREYGNTFEELR